MLTFSSAPEMVDFYHRRGRPLTMASRYAPKGKADLYEELCRVITREHGTGKVAVLHLSTDHDKRSGERPTPV